MEDAADARFNVTAPYEQLRQGAMDRSAEIPLADAWGKPLTEGYNTVSPGVVQKEFDIVLEQGELLNEVMHGLFVKAEQIPSALPLFWRQLTTANAHPQVLVQGHPHRVARFEELLNEKQRPLRNGWIYWTDQDGEHDGGQPEVQRLLWLGPFAKDRLKPEMADKVRCNRAGCGVTESPRWAVAYRVAEVGANVPLPGQENELLCKSCATPDCDAARFIEEDA